MIPPPRLEPGASRPCTPSVLAYHFDRNPGGARFGFGLEADTHGGGGSTYSVTACFEGATYEDQVTLVAHHDLKHSTPTGKPPGSWLRPASPRHSMTTSFTAAPTALPPHAAMVRWPDGRGGTLAGASSIGSRLSSGWGRRDSCRW